MSIYGKTNEDCQNEVKDEDDVGWVGDAEEEEEEGSGWHLWHLY